MPWKEVNPMDEKILFIGDHLRGGRSLSELCVDYGISRKTGYKWLARYEAAGVEGLHDRSRKPKGHPAQTPYAIRQQIIELRTGSRLTPGAKKIQAKLVELYPDIEPPAVSTINKILRQAGLSKARAPRRRYDRYREPLIHSETPNQLWSVDFKGQFRLGNGQWCYPLTVMDDYSRHLMTVTGQASTNTKDTQAAFTRLFKHFGMPERIRSDNGVPFSSRATAGLSSLSIWWIKLGIHPERIEPGKPQQNGKHERMHRTLKHYTLKPASRSMAGQQQRFDSFTEAYNTERPHEGLQMKTPAQCYYPSERPFPTQLKQPEYPSYFEVKKVSNNGVIYWQRGMVYIAHLLKDEYIGLDEIDNGIFEVYFGHYRLGRIDVTVPLTAKRNYWSIMV